MNRTFRLTATLAVLAAGGTSLAVGAEGPTAGAAVLQSHFDSDHFSVEDIDKKDIGWKITAGYRFTPNLAVEGAYTDFGKSHAPAISVGGPFEASADAISLFGVGLWPVGPVDLFAKAGAARINAKGNVGAVLFDDKATEFAYGAGAQLNLGRLGLRAEYEKFDTDVIGDLDIVSLGFVFTFGAAE